LIRLLHQGEKKETDGDRETFWFFLGGAGEKKHGLLRQINNRVHARTFTKKKEEKE
jgi:hypothetical protein